MRKFLIHIIAPKVEYIITKKDFFYLFFIALILVPFIQLVYLYISIRFGNDILVNTRNITDPIIQIELFSLLLIPVIEEVIYRLPLKLSSFNLKLSSISFVFYLIFKNNIYSLFTNLTINTLLLKSFLLLVFSFVFVFIFSNKSILFHLSNVWKKRFPLIFHILIVIFTVFHINNLEFDNLKDFIILVPIYFAGLVISYIRLKYGFIWGIIFHSFFNSFLYVAFILSLFLPFANVSKQEEDMFNKIQKVEIEYKRKVDSLENILRNKVSPR